MRLIWAIADACAAIEDAEQRSLAEYIVRRKVILDFIEILLEKVRDDTWDSSYQREDILHSFMRLCARCSCTRMALAASEVYGTSSRAFLEFLCADTEKAKLAARSAQKEVLGSLAEPTGVSPATNAWVIDAIYARVRPQRAPDYRTRWPARRRSQ